MQVRRTLTVFIAGKVNATVDGPADLAAAVAEIAAAVGVDRRYNGQEVVRRVAERNLSEPTAEASAEPAPAVEVVIRYYPTKPDLR